VPSNAGSAGLWVIAFHPGRGERAASLGNDATIPFNRPNLVDAEVDCVLANEVEVGWLPILQRKPIHDEPRQDLHRIILP
jgi:hypothetical protein